MPRRLPLRFFRRDSLSLARDLLGTVLVHATAEGVTAGRIVEVEAYRGPEDRAAHSYGGRRTPRNEVMYGRGGRAYVYFVYGMHYCFNVVAADVDIPEAVLVRALEPVAGEHLMRERRKAGSRVASAELARGPGNLCRAMGISGEQNGADLRIDALHLERGRPLGDAKVGAAPRIGVDYAGAHAARRWRLFERGNPSVSHPPKHR